MELGFILQNRNQTAVPLTEQPVLYICRKQGKSCQTLMIDGDGTVNQEFVPPGETLNGHC